VGVPYTVSSTTTYDSLGLGRPMESFDGTKAGSTNRIISRTYDVRGRVKVETRKGDVLTSLAASAVPVVDQSVNITYTYDGDWLKQIDSPGNVDNSFKRIIYDYDKSGRAITATDFLTGAISYKLYDAMGNVSVAIDPLLYRTEYFYDKR